MLVALTLMIAESRTEEKDVMVKESMNWKLERIHYCITAPRMV